MDRKDSGEETYLSRVNRKFSGMICMTAAAIALAWSIPAMAEEQPEQELPRNQWIDVEKGPGGARWVDENGVVSETPGVKPRPDGQGEDETRITGPGYSTKSGGEEQPEQDASLEEAGQPVQGSLEGETEQLPQDSAAGENSQSVQEEMPAEGAGQGERETSGRAIDPNRPMVALTFDDGPYAPVGNQIMDCLAQYGGKATFYVVGDRCAAYQAEMQRMAAEGHEIGNHTYNHKYLHKVSAEEIQYQVNKGIEAVQAACGAVPATMRLPGGNKNATVLANVHVPVIMWSIDTLDWKTRNTQSTVDKVLGNVSDGDIVLMHELYRATGDAAVQIIPALVERGYQLVTVSELAKYRGGLQGGHVYYAFRP